MRFPVRFPLRLHDAPRPRPPKVLLVLKVVLLLRLQRAVVVSVALLRERLEAAARARSHVAC